MIAFMALHALNEAIPESDRVVHEIRPFRHVGLGLPLISVHGPRQQRPRTGKRGLLARGILDVARSLASNAHAGGHPDSVRCLAGMSGLGMKRNGQWAWRPTQGTRNR